MIKNMNPAKKIMIHKQGKTYFSAATERNFYFFLTIVMLMIGFCVKIGLL